MTDRTHPEWKAWADEGSAILANIEKELEKLEALEFDDLADQMSISVSEAYNWIADAEPTQDESEEEPSDD